MIGISNRVFGQVNIAAQQRSWWDDLGENNADEPGQGRLYEPGRDPQPVFAGGEVTKTGRVPVAEARPN